MPVFIAKSEQGHNLARVETDTREKAQEKLNFILNEDDCFEPILKLWKKAEYRLEQVNG